MTFLACLLAVGALYLLVQYGSRILSSWMGDRLVARILSQPDAPSARLMPESLFIIHMSDTEIACHRPEGTIESVRWDDLEKVEVLATSDGPLLPDKFWVLRGSQGGCCIPWGATSDLELLKRLQLLPGFDNSALLQPSESTPETWHLCWQKTPAE